MYRLALFFPCQDEDVPPGGSFVRFLSPLLACLLLYIDIVYSWYLLFASRGFPYMRVPDPPGVTWRDLA
jgi:hypothetical protein